jgi:exosome complex RNA-binding protein Csl4
MSDVFPIDASCSRCGRQLTTADNRNGICLLCEDIEHDVVMEYRIEAEEE